MFYEGKSSENLKPFLKKRQYHCRESVLNRQMKNAKKQKIPFNLEGF